MRARPFNTGRLYTLFDALDQIGPLLAHDTRHGLLAFRIDGSPSEFVVMVTRPAGKMTPLVIVRTDTDGVDWHEMAAIARDCLARAVSIKEAA